jgi:hypothetical protein
MAIKSNTDRGRFVFHSINTDPKSSGRTIFTCHKDLFEEARSICSSLVLYMQNHVGPENVHAINKCFTKKALNDAGGEWHEATQQVLTKAEIRALALRNSDQGAGYNEVVHIENILEAAATEPIQLAKDDDTISAMTAERNVRSTLQARLIAHNAAKATQSTSHICISTQDTVSTLTSNTPIRKRTKTTDGTITTEVTKTTTDNSNSSSKPPKSYEHNPYMSTHNPREFTPPPNTAAQNPAQAPANASNNLTGTATTPQLEVAQNSNNTNQQHLTGSDKTGLSP